MTTVRMRLILSFLLLLLVPSLCVGYFSYDIAHTELESKIQSASKANVELVNKTINQYITPIMLDTDLLASQLSAAAVDRKDPTARKLIEGFVAKHPEIELITLGNDNGSWMKAPDPGPQDYDPRKRDWYIGTLKNQGKVFVSQPYISATTKNTVVTISQAFPDGKGVIGMNLDLKKLDVLLKDVKIGENGYIYLLDTGSKYIVHPANAPGTAAIGQQYEYMLDQDHDFIKYVLNGEPKEAYFATNELTGWKVVGTMVVSEFDSAAKPIWQRTVTVIVVTFIIFAIVAYFIIRSILNPIRELRNGTECIASGDISARITVIQNDEFGALGRDFNAMAESLSQLVGEMSETSSLLAASSQEMTAITEQTTVSLQQVTESLQNVAEAAGQQSRASAETSLAVEEMATGIQRIAEAAGEIAESSERTSQDVQVGSATIRELTEQMNGILQSVSESSGLISNLSRFSAEIATINTAISEIAGQTNLLSLNAAIEAARVGEQGRGFGVVASEIRKLADQSGRMAEQIHTIISQMTGMIATTASVMNDKVVTEVDKGMTITRKAGVAFVQIEQSAGRIVEQIHDITAIAEQMSSGSEQVAASMVQMASSAQLSSDHVQTVSAASEEQLAALQEISSASVQLASMAEQLQGIVNRFKRS
ncbi:methyl-accepting chemotaxis protein [Paenibacillus chartarius]|uniref:Methyl-accepting chemotaxis protein n=1 Tax=Paenibacillus chartarius TaxID=747481 RepID=A0ABV6DKC0_9BACL